MCTLQRPHHCGSEISRRYCCALSSNGKHDQTRSVGTEAAETTRIIDIDAPSSYAASGVGLHFPSFPDKA